MNIDTGSEDIKVTTGSGDIWKDLGIMGPVEALAESWASIDGKLDKFRDDKAEPDPTSGYYEGYISDAEEMIRRLEKRGWTLAPTSLVKRDLSALSEASPRASEPQADR